MNTNQMAELEQLILSGVTVTIARKQEKDKSFSIAIIAEDDTVKWWDKRATLSEALAKVLEGAK